VFVSHIETNKYKIFRLLAGFDTPFAENAQGYSTSGMVQAVF